MEKKMKLMEMMRKIRKLRLIFIEVLLGLLWMNGLEFICRFCATQYFPGSFLNASWWWLWALCISGIINCSRLLSLQALKKQEAKADENEDAMRSKLRQTETEKSQVRPWKSSLRPRGIWDSLILVEHCKRCPQDHFVEHTLRRGGL